MTNEKRLVNLIRKIGIDPKFFGNLPLSVAREFLKKYLSSLNKVYHPDTYISSGKKPDNINRIFSDFVNIKEILNSINIIYIYTACKSDGATSKDGEIRELEDFVESKQHKFDKKMNEILSGFVLNQYSHKLQEVYSERYLLMSSPHQLFGNDVLSVDTLFNSDWFLQRVDTENERMTKEEKKRLEEIIGEIEKKLDIKKKNKDYHESRIKEIQELSSRLQKLSEEEIQNELYKIYLGERERIISHSEDSRRLLDEYETLDVHILNKFFIPETDNKIKNEKGKIDYHESRIKEIQELSSRLQKLSEEEIQNELYKIYLGERERIISHSEDSRRLLDEYETLDAEINHSLNIGQISHINDDLEPINKNRNLAKSHARRTGEIKNELLESLPFELNDRFIDCRRLLRKFNSSQRDNENVPNNLGVEINKLVEKNNRRRFMAEREINYFEQKKKANITYIDKIIFNKELIESFSEIHSRRLSRMISLVNESLLKSLPFEIKDKYIDSRNMLRVIFGRKGDLLSRLNDEGRTIIKKNDSRKSRADEEIEYTQREIDMYKRKLRSPLKQSSLITKDSNEMDIFKFYYDNLEPALQKYFLSREKINWTFQPIALLHFDDHGKISYYNISGIEKSTPRPEEFAETGREIVAILNPFKIESYFLNGINKGTPSIIGLRYHGNNSVNIRDILESKVYEDFTTQPTRNFLVLSVDYSGEDPLYCIEGKIASNFFEDVNNPQIFVNKNALRTVGKK